LMHLYIAVLANAKRTVGGLVFDCGVPPAVKMEYVGRARQVEPHAAGLERKHKDGRSIRILLETAHHFGALCGGRATMQELGRHAKPCLKIALEQATHL